MKINCLNSQYGGLLLKNIQLNHRDYNEWGIHYSSTDINVDNLWFYDFFGFENSSQPDVSNLPLSIYNNCKSGSPIYLYTRPERLGGSGGAKIEQGTITSINNYNNPTAVVRRFFSPFNIINRSTTASTLVDATSKSYTGVSRINTITAPTIVSEYTGANKAENYDSYVKLVLERFGYINKVSKELTSSSYEHVSISPKRFYLLHFTSAAYKDDLTVIFAHDPSWFTNSSFTIRIGRDDDYYNGIEIAKEGVYIYTAYYSATYTLYELPLRLDTISVNNSRRYKYPGT